MSGLVAAAYALRDGHDVEVLERSDGVGGLVRSFSRQGFVFDAGPRAIGKAGMLPAMLADLGIDLPLARGAVSTGIADCVVHHDGEEGLGLWLESLRALFPESGRAIDAIGRWARTCSRMARYLNRVPNPLFTDVFSDPRFLLREFLPLMPGFLASVAHAAVSGAPMERAMAALAPDPGLAEMVTQHFFKGTPVNFVLGYFENFLDYAYPLGGTGRLPEAIAAKIREGGGRIVTGFEAARIDCAARRVVDARGEERPYDVLVWCADLASLYARADVAGLSPGRRAAIARETTRFAPAKPGESVFQVFLGIDKAPESFGAISRGHFIYTPSPEGLGDVRRGQLDRLKARFSETPRGEVLAWLSAFCRRNSYEVSIPALKDPSLAPSGQTGMAVSLLFDGGLCRLVSEAGWFEEFRQAAVEGMLDALEGSIYPDLRSGILFRDSATPLTIERGYGSAGGAITGWNMEGPVPVPRSLPGVFGAPRTAIPGVLKAGQWSYSPSGVPVAMLTGRVAASLIRRARGSS